MEGVVGDLAAGTKGLECDRIRSPAWKISTCYFQAAYVEEVAAFLYRWDCSLGVCGSLEEGVEHENIAKENGEAMAAALAEAVVRRQKREQEAHDIL
jgi:hypothetical protein